MIFVTKGHGSIAALRQQRLQEYRWIYLGKSAVLRHQAASGLDESRWLRIGALLHRISEEVRRPYLDFISEIGHQQKDPLIWWSTRLSWRDWVASDFFLHLCYLLLVKTLIAEPNRGTLVIVVEDAWVFEQIKQNYRRSPQVVCLGSSWLLGIKIARVMRGLAARAGVLSRLAIARLIQQIHHSGKLPEAATGGGVAIFTWPQARGLEKNFGWKDLYFPGLEKFLQERGISFFRIAPFQPTGLEREIGKRARYFWPLILSARWLDFFNAALVFWSGGRRYWDRSFEGVPIAQLLKREWWDEVSSTGTCVGKLNYLCYRRLFEQVRVSAVLYPFENQPWEKMLCLAAQRGKVRTVGYQHATVPRFHLAQFLGRSEDKIMPLPEVIMLSGRYTLALFQEHNYPPTKLRLGGSWRYQYLWNQTQAELPNYESNSSGPVNSPKKVLALLSIDPVLSQQMVAALKKTALSKASKSGVQIVIKPHPVVPPESLGLNGEFEQHRGGLDAALQSHEYVLCSGTTSGIEAILMGKRVLRYRPESILDVDPMDALPPQAVRVCDDGDLEHKLASLVDDAPPILTKESHNQIQLDLFGPLNAEVWREALC